MSPLPISRSALDRLGERLAASDHISDADYDLLAQVLDAYRVAMDETRDRLIRLGYAPTTRLKTTAVLIDKLRREAGMKLKGVQDVAGARIVTPGGCVEQDEIVARIVADFADEARPPKVKDRRVEPVAGYRAVHVVVAVQHVPVEIQVRTWRQDQWAQIVEALGDKWGRGIRYGERPPDQGRSSEGLSRAEVWDMVLELGDSVDAYEREAVEAAALMASASDATRAALSSAMDQWSASNRKALEVFARGVQHLD